jgi:hypothetical protein
MKNGRLVDFIRHESAEIWGLGMAWNWYSKIIASTVFFESSQVNTLPKAKSETRSKQNEDMYKFSSVYSERGVPLPVLT